MASVEQSIDLEVPVKTAYDRWTQFEDFPKFMKGVKEIRQIDDTHLHWKASIGGRAPSSGNNSGSLIRSSSRTR